MRRCSNRPYDPGPEGPFTVLAADANTALGHVPKDQHASRFADQLPVAGVERIEVFQGPLALRSISALV